MRPFKIPSELAEPRNAGLLRDALEQHFGDEANYQIKWVKKEESYQFPDGSYMFQCTNHAIQVYRELELRLGGKIPCHILGFSKEENPRAGILKNGDDGHDFAVVANRFIVDGWIKNSACASSKAVFDMQDPAQTEEIARIYGDTKAFSRLERLENSLRAEHAVLKTEKKTQAKKARL